MLYFTLQISFSLVLRNLDGFYRINQMFFAVFLFHLPLCSNSNCCQRSLISSDVQSLFKPILIYLEIDPIPGNFQVHLYYRHWRKYLIILNLYHLPNYCQYTGSNYWFGCCYPYYNFKNNGYEYCCQFLGKDHHPSLMN